MATDKDFPAWFIALVDQRMALVQEALGDLTLDKLEVVMVPLTEPAPDASEAELTYWERRCDHCGKYCKDETPFYTGHIVKAMRNGKLVHLMFGMCEPCAKTLPE